MNNNNQINQQQVFIEEDTIDIRKLFFTLRKGWYFFLIFPLIMGISAYLYLRYTIPEYQVKGSILIKSDEGGGLSTDMLSQELMGFGLGGSSEVMDEARILQSRTIMEEVVTDLGLQSRVLKDGRIKDTDLYGKSSFVVDSFSFSEAYLEKRITAPLVYKAKIIDANHYVLIKDDIEYKGIFDSLMTNEFGSYLFRYNPTVEEQDGYIIQLSTIFNTVLAYQKKQSI